MKLQRETSILIIGDDLHYREELVHLLKEVGTDNIVLVESDVKEIKIDKPKALAVAEPVMIDAPKYVKPKHHNRGYKSHRKKNKLAKQTRKKNRK